MPSPPAPLPKTFRFGVATAGFQVEGGYNGPGEPANNWADWEQSGKVERSGSALRFWTEYEEHLDRAVAAGCDAFRLSVEWARCRPGPEAVDDTAFERYGAILEACRDRGLEPLVSLHHFTHPHWLGAEFWLRPDSPERFREWAELAVPRLVDRCRHWVTINEINILALQTWMTGMSPPGRRLDVAATVRTVDHLLTAHVLAYDVIKRHQPEATVATNNYCFSVYELDRLVVDLLLSRSHGIGRYDLRPWLVERRDRYYGSLPKPSPVEKAIRRLAKSAVPLDKAFPRAVAAIHGGERERTLDVIQVDYYDPLVSRHLRVPGHRTAGGRNWLPGRMLWDDPVDPTALRRYLELNHERGLDLWVVENGLCNRVIGSRSFQRDDGWDRERYLDAHLRVLANAVDDGLPVGGYFHWTLADNYEWGSYEPRFGLYGIRRNGGAAWSDRDSMGGDAAATYARLIKELRG